MTGKPNNSPLRFLLSKSRALGCLCALLATAAAGFAADFAAGVDVSNGTANGVSAVDAHRRTLRPGKPPPAIQRESVNAATPSHPSA